MARAKKHKGPPPLPADLAYVPLKTYDDHLMNVRIWKARRRLDLRRWRALHTREGLLKIIKEQGFFISRHYHDLAWEREILEQLRAEKILSRHWHSGLEKRVYDFKYVLYEQPKTGGML